LNLLVENRADGHYTVGAEQDTARFTRETLHVKYPAMAGERYATAFLSFRDSAGHLLPALDEVEIEVVRTDTTCTVPAGTFDCIHYRGRRAGMVFADSWYAPGIGWLGSLAVRRDTLDGIPRDITARRVLRAYV